MVGLGVTAMAHIFQGGTEQPDGVSELEIFGWAEGVYYNLGPIEPEKVYAHQGDMNVNLIDSSAVVLNKFPDQYWLKPVVLKSQNVTFIQHLNDGLKPVLINLHLVFFMRKV